MLLFFEYNAFKMLHVWNNVKYNFYTKLNKKIMLFIIYDLVSRIMYDLVLFYLYNKN